MLTVLMVLLLVMAGGVARSVVASPTSSDWMPCKKIAVAILESCLEKDMHDDCWTQSEKGFDHCVHQVQERYSVDKQTARKAAEMKAHQEKMRLNSENKDSENK